MSGEGKTGANRQKKYVESNPDKAQLSQLKKYNNITQKRLEDPDYDKDCREKAKLRKQRQRDRETNLNKIKKMNQWSMLRIKLKTF